MIVTFSIFSFQEGNADEGLQHIKDYLAMCNNYGMLHGIIGHSRNNPDQYVVSGHFEQEEAWEELSKKMAVCELEGDCFMELMPLLMKPPKFYSFAQID